MDTWVWIVIAVVVALLIIGALAAIAMRKKRDSNRERASEIRSDVAQQAPSLRTREAEVEGAEAEAQRARAEADRLEAVAEERRERVEDERSTLQERLHEADRVDPDTVMPKKSDTETPKHSKG